MIREGSSAKNMEAILRYIIENDIDTRHCILVSDDRDPHDLMDIGHMDYTLRKAIKMGLDPLKALQMVTLNPAEYFGLDKTIGSLGVGRKANIAVLSVKDASFTDFNVCMDYLQWGN